MNDKTLRAGGRTALAWLLVSWACAEPAPEPVISAADSAAIVQRALQGTELTLRAEVRSVDPDAHVYVQVLDTAGQPVPIIPVTWVVTGGFIGTREPESTKYVRAPRDFADWYGFSAGDSVRVSAPGAGTVTLAAPAEIALPPLVPAPAPMAEMGRTSVTPPELWPVVGPLVLRGRDQTEPLTTYDANFLRTERLRYAAYERTASGEAAAAANHYGALRSRVMWAIRNGLPIGRAVRTDTSVYLRGRHVVLDYLTRFARPRGHAVMAHENTGLADAEILWVLERNEDARSHLHVSAQAATADRDGTLRFRQSWSDARQVAVALQALSAAHRLGIPFERSTVRTDAGFDPSPGSWLGAGTRLIAWLDRHQIVKSDGSLPSPSHDRKEAFFMNSMLATGLLRWYGYVEANAQALSVARRLVDHLIAEVPAGWPTLPYVTGDAAPDIDLAAFHVWPALVLWQETGEEKYRGFALANLEATHAAYIVAIKEWNETYSTLAQGAEALLAGIRWR